MDDITDADVRDLQRTLARVMHEPVNSDTVQDAVAVALLRATERNVVLPDIRKWLYVTACNVVRDERKAFRNARRAALTETDWVQHRTPHDTMEAQEAHQQTAATLRAVMDRVRTWPADEQRAVLWMALGVNMYATGRALQCNPAALRTRVWRRRKELRRLFPLGEQ